MNLRLVRAGPAVGAIRSFILAALLAAASAMPALGQTGTVQGWVRSVIDEEGIPGATVQLEERRVLTNSAGRFEFTDVPVGRVRLQVSAFRYRPRSVDVEVREGETTTLSITLDPAPVQLPTVRTEAQRSIERERFEEIPSVGQFSIAQATLTAVPGIGEADVLRVVQLLPGVLARNDFDAGYNVRGGESDQNLILLDGIPVYNPFHLGGLFGTFIDDAVERADLQAGGFGAAYGGRLSSVLEVDSREEARGGVHGSAGLSLLASTLTLGGAPGAGNTSWNIAARRTYADLLASKVTDYGFPYYFQDAQGHLTRVMNNGSTFGLTAYIGQDVLDGTFAGTEDSTNIGGGDVLFKWGNALVGAAFTLPFSNLLGDSATFTQRASVSRFTTTLDLGDGALVFDNEVLDFRLRGSLERHGDAHTPSIGYEVARYDVNYDIRSEQLTADLFTLEQQPTSIALYAQDRWRVTPKLLAQVGVRAENVELASWTGISPRASLKYFVNPDLAITAAGGRYAQWMHAVRDEDLPLRIFDFWVSADEFVPVSMATHGLLGAEWWVNDSRFVRIEAFLKEYDRLLEPDPEDDPIVRGDEFRNVEGRSYGLDLLVRQLDVGPLSGWLAYTFTINDRIKDGVSYDPAQDRRHNLNLVATYRLPNDYVLSGRFGFGTGTPYTPIEGQLVRRVYDPVRQKWGGDGGDRQADPVGGPRNVERYPAYHRLDFSISRPFVKERVIITPFLQIVNAYNRRNVWIYKFDYEDNPPTSEAVSQFPILPTLGVTVEW
jgi:hypothetical protein